MSNRGIAFGLFAAFALLVCLVMWGKAQVPVQAGPQKFPAPADLGAVRMHFLDGHMTIYAPSSKVTTRPGMDKATTVIEIDTTSPAQPAKSGS